MQHNTILVFEEARDFSSTVNATYFFLKQNFKAFAKSLVFIAGPAVLLAGVLFAEMIGRMIGAADTFNEYAPTPIGMASYFSSGEFFLQIFGALIFALVGGVLTISATYGFLIAYKRKQSTDIQVNDVWTEVKKLFWTNFANVFLYYIGLILGALLLAIPLLLLTAVAGLIHPVLSVVFAFAYYVVIIFLVIYFSMVFIITNYERTDFFTALGRLFKLSRGKFWSIIGVGGINVYVQTIFSYFFLIPWYIYSLMVEFHTVTPVAENGPSSTFVIVMAVFMMFYFMSNVLLYALPLVGLGFQYFSLVEFRESRGLLGKLKNFGEQPLTANVEHEDY